MQATQAHLTADVRMAIAARKLAGLISERNSLRPEDWRAIRRQLQTGFVLSEQQSLTVIRAVLTAQAIGTKSQQPARTQKRRYASRKVTVELPVALIEALKRLAASEGTTFAAEVTTALLCRAAALGQTHEYEEEE